MNTMLTPSTSSSTPYRMRKLAEESRAELGVTSHYAPCYLTASGAAPPEVNSHRSPFPGELPSSRSPI
jgi:hypothetical protein